MFVFFIIVCLFCFLICSTWTGFNWFWFGNVPRMPFVPRYICVMTLILTWIKLTLSFWTFSDSISWVSITSLGVNSCSPLPFYTNIYWKSRPTPVCLQPLVAKWSSPLANWTRRTGQTTPLYKIYSTLSLDSGFKHVQLYHCYSQYSPKTALLDSSRRDTV